MNRARERDEDVRECSLSQFSAVAVVVVASSRVVAWSF